jgi:hypothetical protein
MGRARRGFFEGLVWVALLAGNFLIPERVLLDVLSALAILFLAWRVCDRLVRKPKVAKVADGHH